MIVTYSPSDTVFSLGESYLVGWNSIAIAPNSNTFSPAMGIRGKHSRVATYDTSATVTLSLPQGSEWNDILSKILLLDQKNGTGRCEIQMKNNTSGVSFASTEAFIVGYSPIVYTNNMATREWKISCLSTSTINSAGDLISFSGLIDAAIGEIISLV